MKKTCSLHKPILIGFLLVALVPSTVNAISTARLEYTIDERGETEPVQFEVNIYREGVRYDYRQGERYRSLLFRADSSPILYTINHNTVRGLKISRPGIERYVRLIKRKRKQVKERIRKLPKQQRRTIEEQMNLPEFDENKTLERPRFQPSGDTLWHGLRARTGEFHTADGSVGRAIISRSPLVQLTDGEAAVLSKFSRFLYRWISISSQMSGAEMNSPRNLIAKQYKKLIRYRNSDVDMELGDWDRLERSNGFFQVPSTYRVESLNRVGGSDTTKE